MKEPAMEEHWFDTLNKTLVPEHPRRTLLGAAAAVATSLGLLALPESGLGKKRSNGKNGKNGENKKQDRKKEKKQDRDKNRKSKVTPLLCDPYLLEGCNVGSSFVSGEPKACEETCERCHQEGSAFCLVPTGDDDYPRQPTCCHYAEECCGHPNFGFGECCTSDQCCDDAGEGRFCAPPGHYCCRNGLGGACEFGYTCCGGECVRCTAPDVLNLATCQCELPCGGACVGPGLACCNGACVDVQRNDAQCGSDCAPCLAREECCGGICLDRRFSKCCPAAGVPGETWACLLHEVCCTTPDGAPACCRDETPT